MRPQCSTNAVKAWKNSRFILPDRSHFYIVVNLSVYRHHFQLMRYYYQGIWTAILISEVCHLIRRWYINSVLLEFTGRLMPLVCLSQAMQQRIGFSKRIFRKRLIINIVSISLNFFKINSASWRCFFSMKLFSTIRSIDVHSC